MSVSETVEESIKASFFGIFEANIGFSLSTGYDWGSVDSTTKSDAKSYQIELEILPHEKAQIEAAVGNCGSNEVHTQLYRY